MTNLEKLKFARDAIGDDASIVQVMFLIDKIIEVVEDKEKIGFKNEKEK